MGLFSKKPEKELSAAQRTAYRRVFGMNDEQLFAWAEHCLFSVGSTLSAYRESRQEELLLEARMGSETLQIILQQIEDRRKAGF